MAMKNNIKGETMRKPRTTEKKNKTIIKFVNYFTKEQQAKHKAQTAAYDAAIAMEVV